MAITYGFFNSKDGDRKYNAAQIGRYLQGLVSSGVYADVSTSLQVLSSGGLTVTVQKGRAMLDTHFLENDEPLDIILAAGSTQPRIDAVVMVLDMLERECRIEVKQGTPSANPHRPTMTRTDAKQEYMLAAIYVNNLATSVSQADITDTRGDSSVCGWVHGLIDQVDTSTLFAQWEAAYQGAFDAMTAYIESQQAGFDAWFATLTEQLNVSTYIQEYVTTTETTYDTYGAELPSEYDPDTDLILVNVGGLLWTTNEYTVAGVGDLDPPQKWQVKFNNPVKAGYTIELRVLKSAIGYATNASATTLMLDSNDGNVLTDGGAALTD